MWDDPRQLNADRARDRGRSAGDARSVRGRCGLSASRCSRCRRSSFADRSTRTNPGASRGSGSRGTEGHVLHDETCGCAGVAGQGAMGAQRSRLRRAWPKTSRDHRDRARAAGALERCRTGQYAGRGLHRRLRRRIAAVLRTRGHRRRRHGTFPRVRTDIETHGTVDRRDPLVGARRLGDQDRRRASADARARTRRARRAARALCRVLRADDRANWSTRVRASNRSTCAIATDFAARVPGFTETSAKKPTPDKVRASSRGKHAWSRTPRISSSVSTSARRRSSRSLRRSRRRSGSTSSAWARNLRADSRRASSSTSKRRWVRSSACSRKPS